MENSFKLVFHFQINFEYAGELKESLFLLLTWWKFHVCENEKNLASFKILKKKREPHLLKSWTTVNNFKLVFDFKLILNMQGILLIVESFMSLKMNGVFGGSIESIEMFFFFYWCSDHVQHLYLTGSLIDRAEWVGSQLSWFMFSRCSMKSSLAHRLCMLKRKGFHRDGALPLFFFV